MREGAHSKPMDVKLNQSVMLKLSKLEANKGQIDGLPKNPRIIKDEKFKKLVKSIEENPEMTSLREILVYPHGDKYVVIGGNMRLKAMKELGYKEAPCKIIPEETTVEQLKAYTIKDNSGFGEWDFDMLTSEWDLQLLSDCAVDIPQIEDESPLIDDKQAVEDDFDEETDKVEPICKTGDIWKLGEHRLMCGDSTDAGSVALLMDGNKADMVFTDPPYGMRLDTDYSGMSGNGRKGKKYEKVIGDNDDFSPLLITSIFNNFDCEEIFLWGVDYYFDLIPNFKDGSLIVWDKTLQTNGDAGYNSEFELLWSKNPHKKEVIHFNWFRYFAYQVKI